jgi:YHS domain-containing protein
MRIFFYLLLVLAIYWLIKSFFKPSSKPNQELIKNKTNYKLEDELVKDVVCGVYIPKKKAIKLKIKEEVYYFCSEKCRKAYMKKKEEENEVFC